MHALEPDGTIAASSLGEGFALFGAPLVREHEETLHGTGRGSWRHASFAPRSRALAVTAPAPRGPSG